MANSDASVQSKIANEEENNLKHMEFVQVAALNAMVYFSNLYDHAKDNSGPLKPGVETVEGTFKTVVGPVFDQYHDVPIELLKFVDRKVDESICKVSHLPLNFSDMYSKYEPTAKQLYSKYEPVAEQYAVSTWQKLNQLPLFPRVVQVVVPTAAYCSEKYNQTVLSTAEKGYTVSSYLPLVPTEKIGKMFSNDKDK